MALDRVKRFLDKVMALDEDKILTVILSDKELQKLIIDLNTEEQLYHFGIDSLGRSLGSYSPFTEQIKRAKGQRVDHITLKDTGEFYRSFKVTVTKTAVVITADPNKEDSNLFDDFGVEIVGLTEESREFVINVIQNSFISKTKESIAA